MEHISLEIFDLDGKGSKYASLGDDASITVTDTSEIFASGDVWSFTFALNAFANGHIFGTSGEIHGSRLHDLLNNRRARLWVEGLPLYIGFIKLDNEAEVDENGDVDMSFESGKKTFENMIDGARANQVPLMGDVRFGVALWRKRKVELDITLSTLAKISCKAPTGNGMGRYVFNDVHFTHTADGEEEADSVQFYPRMVFPKGTFLKIGDNDREETIDCLNTDTPYDDAHPYCNVAYCYQRYGYERTDLSGNVTYDYSSEPEAQRGYEYMPPNRVNSAPNFFVIYWIRALMKHLGIYVEENQMMDVEDLRRLFFVNTKCAYREPNVIRGANPDSGYARYRFKDTAILVPEEEVVQYGDDLSGASLAGVQIGEPVIHTMGEGHWDDISLTDVKVRVSASHRINDNYEEENNYLHDAFATSECFPDADISEVIKSLEDGFGIRLLFSNDYQRVRIVLLQNIFRDGDTQEVDCDVIMPDTKVENNIRGFRMTYGDKKDDTHFYYKGFADKLPHQQPYFVDDSDNHDYSQWNLDADYNSLIRRVSAFDKTCYVTANTGNAYGIKIDKDAKRYRDLHPSLFEFAGFMDAEDGDCTGEEDTIETIDVGFTPAIVNDLNFEIERNAQTEREKEQRFALFADDAMRPRRPDLEDLPDEAKQPGVKSYNDSNAVYSIDEMYRKYGPNGTNGSMTADGVVKPGEFAITSDTHFSRDNISMTYSTSFTIYDASDSNSICYIQYPVTFGVDGYVNEGYRLYLQDNYEPNDDGISPIETHDWGLMLGIMRGSGSDAHVDYEPDPDDSEDNETWEVIAGSNATTHPDICDSYGNLWDYNGSGRETIIVSTAEEAITQMGLMWPDSNFDLVERTSGNYLTGTVVRYRVYDDEVKRHTLLLAAATADGTTRSRSQIINYVASYLEGKSVAQMYATDAAQWGILIEVGSSDARSRTLLALQKKAFGGAEGDIYIDNGPDNGVGVTDGRFSLKLRAEKLNPFFDPTLPESADNRRYLEITDENLRGRGLCDRFYKEYSYWVRNARIIKRTVKMELAQLLSIDKTKRVTIGDITGFIRKMQFTVSNETGLGPVTMEIMYL